MSKLTKKEARVRRHRRLRHKVQGTAERPRMSVFCSGKHIYVQLVDDAAGHTLVAVSTLETGLRENAEVKPTVAGATVLGKLAAERAAAAKIDAVVFDRGGFKYHGKIKAVAEAAREAGLKF